ncbi:GFA family protein [Sphingoaurantiacus capsulatus]|uniref:GFA family protein n=1 Tax=Sphingoaurantiacus capsulatus TaxID=1771310 RepID=A0ABV7X7X8_9SPHN
MTEMAGGCLCGAVRFTAQVHSDDAYLCHCRMCQRAIGNVSVAMVNALKAEVSWADEPSTYRSSPIATRGFCGVCGTSLTFAYDDSEKLDLLVGTFDDPSRFRPKHHFGVEHLHRNWLDTSGLPEYRVDEYQPIVDRWMKSVGKLPE